MIRTLSERIIIINDIERELAQTLKNCSAMMMVAAMTMMTMTMTIMVMMTMMMTMTMMVWAKQGGNVLAGNAPRILAAMINFVRYVRPD